MANLQRRNRSGYHPDSDITRLTNEVNRMMEQSKVEFKTIANSILECASAKFDCCSIGENDELTQVILEMYAESQTEKGLDEDLIAQTVDEIVVDENGKITLRLRRVVRRLVECIKVSPDRTIEIILKGGIHGKEKV